MSDASSELEVHFRPETGKAVIEGKTVVPFQSFVALILQRKVLHVAKTWGKAPVVVDSELLTSLASAPQDSQENRSQIILVSMVAGGLAGIAVLAAAQAILLVAGYTLGYREFGAVLGCIAVGIGAVWLMMSMQRRSKGEKLIETMENVSAFFSSRR